MPIPLEFLLDASTVSLQDLEIASLNRSANLSKTLRVELEAWVAQEASAMLARWFIEHREAMMRVTVEVQPKKVELFNVQEKSA